jgi:hypothetical protein
VQDCIRTKEKLATAESDLQDKNARLRPDEIVKKSPKM